MASSFRSRAASGFNFFAPLAAGWAFGWYGFGFADQQGYIPPEWKKSIYNERLAIWLNKLPVPWKKVSADGEGEDPPRVPFSDVLRSCRVQEQLEWLTETIESEIPFIYTEDLFRGFAEIHEGKRAELQLAGSLDALMYGSGDAFAAEPELVRNIWIRSIQHVLTPSTGVRFLAVLSANQKNAMKITSQAKETVPAEVPSKDVKERMMKGLPSSSMNASTSDSDNTKEEWWNGASYMDTLFASMAADRENHNRNTGKVNNNSKLQDEDEMKEEKVIRKLASCATAELLNNIVRGRQKQEKSKWFWQSKQPIVGKSINHKQLLEKIFSVKHPLATSELNTLIDEFLRNAEKGELPAHCSSTLATEVGLFWRPDK